jgi:hypothetical protein
MLLRLGNRKRNDEIHQGTRAENADADENNRTVFRETQHRSKTVGNTIKTFHGKPNVEYTRGVGTRDMVVSQLCCIAAVVLCKSFSCHFPVLGELML